MDAPGVGQWSSPVVPAGMATESPRLMTMFASSTPRSPLLRDQMGREGPQEATSAPAPTVKRNLHHTVDHAGRPAKAAASKLRVATDGGWRMASESSEEGLAACGSATRRGRRARRLRLCGAAAPACDNTHTHATPSPLEAGSRTAVRPSNPRGGNNMWKVPACRLTCF